MSSPPKNERNKGFSLVEAVIASFLLLGAVLMSVSLFDGTLQAEVGNEKRVLAALAAETVMADIRQTADTDFESVLTSFDGHTHTLPDYPGFQIRSRVERNRLANPCTPLEAGQYTDADLFPAPEGRFLRRSAYKAQVDVTWDDRGNQGVSLTENIFNFTPSIDFSVVITHNDNVPVGDSELVSLTPRDIRQFRVSATADGQEIRDLQFTWYVQPLTGTGSIHRVSRDGRRCQYLNGYRTFNGNVHDAPGVCNLVVEATFQGIRAVDTVEITNEE